MTIKTLINRAKFYKLSAVVLISCTISCNRPKQAVESPEKGGRGKEIEKQQETDSVVFAGENLEVKEVKIDDYIFKFGYSHYDENKYGFANPAFLKVFKDGVMVFEDLFKGQGDIYIAPLGHHKLSGDKIVFSLNWGTEACDYHQCSRYYIVTEKGQVNYLKEYCSISGGDGYASRTFQHIFPEDSLGKANTLAIVEGMIFHEHDQPDLSDTTRISFRGDKYSIVRLTNNLDKAK